MAQFPRGHTCDVAYDSNLWMNASISSRFSSNGCNMGIVLRLSLRSASCLSRPVTLLYVQLLLDLPQCSFQQDDAPAPAPAPAL